MTGFTRVALNARRARAVDRGRPIRGLEGLQRIRNEGQSLLFLLIMNPSSPSKPNYLKEFRRGVAPRSLIPRSQSTPVSGNEKGLAESSRAPVVQRARVGNKLLAKTKAQPLLTNQFRAARQKTAMVVQTPTPPAVQSRTIQSRIDALGAFSNLMSKAVRLDLTQRIQGEVEYAGLIKSLTARVDQLYADSAKLAKAGAKVQKNQARMPLGALQAELSSMEKMARAIHDDAGNLKQLIGALGITDAALDELVDVMTAGRVLIDQRP